MSTLLLTLATANLQDRAAAAGDNAAGAAAQRLRSLFPEAQQRDQQAALARQSQVCALTMRYSRTSIQPLCSIAIVISVCCRPSA